MSMRNGYIFVLAITLWRVIMLTLNPTDLFVDEAQYWFWGQNLDFGYYSKPPLIAWVIRGVTALAGSDSAFWVRVPGPVLHMITALVLMQVAVAVYGRRTAAWVGPVYVALPLVTVGSALFSTDTVMLPFYALALWAYVRLWRRPSISAAALMGAAIGLGLMAKYAMIFFVLGAALAALLLPSARIRWRDALISAVVAFVFVSPNLIWNISNGATTILHTAENANWAASGGLRLGSGAEFFLSQFAVFGPVFFAVLLLAAVLVPARRIDSPAAFLLILALTPLIVITGQALASRAYANWAVTGYLPATVLVVHMLRQGAARWLVAGHVLNLALVILIPVVSLFASRITLPNGELLLQRYVGRAALSEAIAEVAKATGVPVIVAQHRSVLADLNYTLRDRPVTIYALPRDGFAGSYYEQSFPVPDDLTGQALYVSLAATPPCDTDSADTVAQWMPKSGAYNGSTITVFQVPAGCLTRSAGARQ